MKQFKMLLIGLISIFMVSGLWGMDSTFNKLRKQASEWFNQNVNPYPPQTQQNNDVIDDLSRSYYDHDNPNAIPRELTVPTNPSVTPSFNPVARSQAPNLSAPQNPNPEIEFKQDPMNQSSLGFENNLLSGSNLDFNALDSKSSLGSGKQPIPQLQPTIEPARPVIFAVKPSKETIIAVNNNQAPYFTNKLDVLIKSLPYFLSHDLDSDQTKKNALHSLKMIQNQLIRKKENKECRTIIQNAMNTIENGFSSKDFIIKILNAYDATKFPTNSIIQSPEQSKLNILKEQLDQLKTQQLVFIEGNRKPTAEWLIGVKNLFRAITSDIILGMSQLKTIKTNTGLENIKPSLLENVNFMIASIEALDSTLKLGSERRLLLIRLYKFIRTFSLNSNHATINNWIKEIKKIKIATIEKTENPDTLETSSLLMQNAETNLETQTFRTKRKPILQKLREQNIIIQKATAGKSTTKSRLSKEIKPKYINLLMERIETLNEYLTLISPHGDKKEEELKGKIKNDILDDLDRISIYTIETKNLLAYPFFKNPSNTKQYLRHPAQYFMDVDKNIADNDLESLKNTFGEFSKTRMNTSSNLPQWKLVTLEKGLQQKKIMFDKFLEIAKDDELCALIPLLLNQIYTYKQLAGLGSVSAEIIQSNKEMINSILERNLIKNQGIRPAINLVKDIIENTSFTPTDRQACLMLSYAILKKTDLFIPKSYNSFFDAINKEVSTKENTTIFSIIDEIAGNYYQKKQLNAAIEALTTLAALLPVLTIVDLSHIPNAQLEDYSKKAEQLQNQFDDKTSSKVALGQINKEITQEIADRGSKNVEEEKPQKVLNQSSSSEDEDESVAQPENAGKQEQQVAPSIIEPKSSEMNAPQPSSPDWSELDARQKELSDEIERKKLVEAQAEKGQAPIPTEEPIKRDPHSGAPVTKEIPQIPVPQEIIQPNPANNPQPVINPSTKQPIDPTEFPLFEHPNVKSMTNQDLQKGLNSAKEHLSQYEIDSVEWQMAKTKETLLEAEIARRKEESKKRLIKERIQAIRNYDNKPVFNIDGSSTDYTRQVVTCVIRLAQNRQSFDEEDKVAIRQLSENSIIKNLTNYLPIELTNSEIFEKSCKQLNELVKEFPIVKEKGKMKKPPYINPTDYSVLPENIEKKPTSKPLQLPSEEEIRLRLDQALKSNDEEYLKNKQELENVMPNFVKRLNEFVSSAKQYAKKSTLPEEKISPKQPASSGLRSYLPSWVNNAIDWISSFFFTTGSARV